MKAWRLANPDKAYAAHRRSRLKQFGITQEDFDMMLVEQDGCCKICGTDDLSATPGRMFDIDHDHLTGVVRGLLCGPCNRGIGQLGEDPDRLQAATDYVRRHRENYSDQ